ncbi:alpha/beta hydrolase [Streptomyces sp. P17]|uniref:alpha/beta fold hydrolase n=1 Tax=Streptomyces sp. P17 TaxID=3074716 RepID=UPI0028F45602|nr:alpha/beta hydrolase [Streptomyces sp. P17]MDT9700267.1 alpha/beta hydrolase [Streptomyces sp. P17]
MMKFREQITASGVSYLEAGETGPLLVFSHGYRDSAKGWEWTARGLVEQGWHVALVQRNEAATSAGDSSAALDAYAAQVIDVIDEIDGAEDGVVLIGQSMGGAVAEAAASKLGAALRGLVLVNPAPLGGTSLPEEVLEQFIAGAKLTSPEAGAQVKLGLTAHPSDDLLVRLTESTPEESVEAALESLLAWVHGHPAGREPSTLSAPVLVVVTDDQFFSEEMLRSVVVPRFSRVSVVAVRDAGHFVHIEQPAALASRIQEFVNSV